LFSVRVRSFERLLRRFGIVDLLAEKLLAATTCENPGIGAKSESPRIFEERIVEAITFWATKLVHSNSRAKNE
jgi:hypothetical protein